MTLPGRQAGRRGGGLQTQKPRQAGKAQAARECGMQKQRYGGTGTWYMQRAAVAGPRQAGSKRPAATQCSIVRQVIMRNQTSGIVEFTPRMVYGANRTQVAPGAGQAQRCGARQA